MNEDKLIRDQVNKVVDEKFRDLLVTLDNRYQSKEIVFGPSMVERDPEPIDFERVIGGARLNSGIPNTLKVYEDRLIVALDVDTRAEAIKLVRDLDNVYCFKLGLRLIFSKGGIPVIKDFLYGRKDISFFVDLKLSGDIPSIIEYVIEKCMELNVKFITFVESRTQNITSSTLATAIRVRGFNEYPKFIGVPSLSSLSSDQVSIIKLMSSANSLMLLGCDGLIASGDTIAPLRRKYPEAYLISPGVRVGGNFIDDHERFSTPKFAIDQGADFIVVGRPILESLSPKGMAQRYIDSIISER